MYLCNKVIRDEEECGCFVDFNWGSPLTRIIKGSGKTFL